MGIFGLDFNLGNTVSSIFDWATKGDNILPLAKTALLTARTLGANEAPTPYQNTEEYARLQMALQEKELANRLQIAQMQAGSAGAGAGAAIQAAKIAAASAMAQLKEKQMADAIMKRIELMQAEPYRQMQGQQMVSSAMQNRGQAAQQGFANMANLLAGARI